MRIIFCFIYIAISTIKNAFMAPVPYLDVYRNNYKIEEYTISLESNYTSDYIGYFIYGKIKYLEQYLHIEQMNKFYKLYSANWIFLLNDTNEILKFMEDMDYGRSNFSNCPIIIPTILKNTVHPSTTKGKIFSVPIELFEHLLQYDFENKDINVYVQLSIDRKIYELPVSLLKSIMLFCIIICMFCIFIWKQKMKIQRRQNFILSRLIIFFPLLKLFLCTLLLFKLNYMQVSKIYIQNQGKEYITFTFLTLNLVYRTLLWFFGVFVASGWEITFTISERAQIKAFFKKYVAIYFLLCIDEGIDSIFTLKNASISLSEIKNIIIYFFIMLLIIHKGNKTYIDIRRQLFMAQLGYNDYIPALVLKEKMIKWHMRIHIIFFVLYSCYVSFLNSTFVLSEVKEFVYHSADLVLVVGYVMIFIPRRLPYRFEGSIGKDVKFFNNVYHCKINEQYKDIRNNIYPVIVLNPGYNNNLVTYTNISIGFPSMLTSNTNNNYNEKNKLINI